MNWKYESLTQEHQLIDGKSILVKIQLYPTKKGNYKVISIISGIYYGQKIQKKLETQKKEWVAYRKKFPNKTQANEYINRKREAISRFIKARESEA
ncbi:MAG: hypothetical protein HUU50_20275 [Candidatus Brocadiae bacterium]|nr:hypothetical protein [Candidatus Brocadiia bacterium]